MKSAKIKENEAVMQRLLAVKDSLVPFIGAGFSRPVCPTWPDFLETYFQSLLGDFLLPEDEEAYRELKERGDADRLEKMADWLIEKSKQGEFKKHVEIAFNKNIKDFPRAENKYRLLHKAFPGLKITTNYDCLIESSAPAGSPVEPCRGEQCKDFDRMM
ncbi:MAG: hypothetical protein L0Y73_09160, partial [Candidatus Aminicenantes bacterium]|nr:hypothetical protein [Candidatus Aminicenantes bacterium]